MTADSPPVWYTATGDGGQTLANIGRLPLVLTSGVIQTFLRDHHSMNVQFRRDRKSFQQ